MRGCPVAEFLASYSDRSTRIDWHAHLELAPSTFRIRYRVQVIRVTTFPTLPGIPQSQFMRVADVGYAKSYDAARHLASEWAAKDRAAEALKSSDLTPPRQVGTG